MEKFFADTVIIGGGASGMLCAVTAAQRNKNKKIILIEKEEKNGRKLLATGNGRCNLTNLCARPENYHGGFSEGVKILLAEYPPEKVISRFADLGLLCVSEPDGRVYPLSRHSSSVWEVLKLALERLSVQTLCGHPVTEIKKEKRRFSVYCGDALIISDKVVVCSGGVTYPALGSDGSLFKILKTLGHTVTPLFPALCPIRSDDKALKRLKGVRCHGRAALLDGEKLIREETGEIQFTEKSLSGICIFNLARYVIGLKNPVVRLSLLSEYSDKELYNILAANRELFSALPSDAIFSGIFRKELAFALVKKMKLNDKTCLEISDKELKSIVRLINNWDHKVSAPDDLTNAQITAGGIYADEVDPSTLESRLIKNLYFCGEVLDADGDCGGYNLQFAFSSALKVGDNI